MHSRNAVDKDALECLPHRYMDQYPSFRHADRMQQKNLQGDTATSLQEVFAVAQKAMGLFKTLMLEMVTRAGLDPEDVVLHRVCVWCCA